MHRDDQHVLTTAAGTEGLELSGRLGILHPVNKYIVCV